MTPFDEWLRQLRTARKGPWWLPAHRNAPFAKVVTVHQELPGSTLRGTIRLAPDQNGQALAEFTVSDAAIGTGLTTFVISLPKAAMQALPADADGDGVEIFAFDLLLTPGGGDEDVLVGGAFAVLGGIAS